MKQGEISDRMFILIKGVANVYIDDHLVAEVTSGNVIGEKIEGVHDQRSATIVAKTDIITLELTKNDYHNTILAFKLDERHLISQFLSGVKYFADWPSFKLFQLADSAIIKNFGKGTILYDIGSEANCLFLVKEGTVRVEVDINLERHNRWPVGQRAWEV